VLYLLRFYSWKRGRVKCDVESRDIVLGQDGTRIVSAIRSTVASSECVILYLKMIVATCNSRLRLITSMERGIGLLSGTLVSSASSQASNLWPSDSIRYAQPPIVERLVVASSEIGLSPRVEVRVIGLSSA
jgi:hypothetical protein